MNEEYVCGLDVGGTKMAALVADVTGPLARVSAPTVKTGTVRALAGQALDLLDAACRQAGVPGAAVQKLGVATCGPFVPLDGMLGIAPPNVCGARSKAADLPNDWDVIPLEQVLRERFQTVAVRNDCAAALLAERQFGAARNEPNCVYVTWSTGIGFGLCVDGHILQGKRGNAGHAGHMLMDPLSDAECGCGNLGDIEAIAAGRNLANRLGCDTADLFNRARAGEAAAVEIANDAARWLGRALYNVVAVLDTRLFLFGGGVWNHHGDWLAPLLRREIGRYFPALTDGVEITSATLGARVTDVGALALVLPPAWLPLWNESQPWNRLSEA